MLFELYQEVALTRNLPEHHLKAGDIATLVDFVPYPSGGEQGCILEVFDPVSDKLSVFTVPISAVKVLHANESWTVRTLVSMNS